MEENVLTIEDGVVTACNKTARSVVIPEGVTRIEWNAFNRSHLKSVSVPCSVEKIGEWAFAYSSLESIVIPDRVGEIEQFTFDSCRSLKSVSFGKGVSKIGYSAFKDCSSLEEIVIGGNVTEIEHCAFEDCKSLSSLVILSPETRIGHAAFMGCESLSKITFGGTMAQWEKVYDRESILVQDGVKTVECTDGEWKKGVFEMIGDWLTKCLDRHVKSVVIDGNVREVGSFSFEGCESLESVVMCEGVKEIRYHAFGCCSSLRSVEIPSTVTKIDGNAFDYCPAVEKIVSHSPLFPFDEKKRKLYDATGKRKKAILTLMAAKEMAKKAKIVQIQNASASAVLESILGGYGSFIRTERTDKESIVCLNAGKGGMEILLSDSDVADWAQKLPALLKFAGSCTDTSELRKYAAENGFVDASKKYLSTRNGCVNLRSGAKPVHLLLGDGSSSIREKAFRLCTSLVSMVISEGVTEIGDKAFFGCEWLGTLSLPGTLEKIGENVFYKCSRLSEITFGGTVEQWKALTDKNENLLMYVPAKTVHCSDGECEKPVCMVVRHTGREIESVQLGYGATKIDDNAFAECKSLAYAMIPEGITEIGNGAFKNSGISGVILPSTLTKIGDGAFEGCRKLSTVILPNGIKKIGGRAFFGCRSLTAIAFNGTAGEWKGVETGDDWGSGIKAQWLRLNDDSLTIENDVVVSCRKDAESVVVNYGVKAIGREAFKDCTRLNYVSFYSTVKEIGENAFLNCSALSNIEFGGTSEDWSNLRTGRNWHKGVPTKYVHCSDGTREF